MLNVLIDSGGIIRHCVGIEMQHTLCYCGIDCGTELLLADAGDAVQEETTSAQ